jgi:prevent-host-death family protein
MTLIKPISDLRNKANEISDLCHSENQPVFITKKGKGDLVVMSHAHYDRISTLLELYRKLGEAEALDLAGEKGKSHTEIIKNLRKKIS